MIVSNAGNLKVGDGYRTPGQEVPEFFDWPGTAQDREIKLRRVVDVSPDVAAKMRADYAEKEARSVVDAKRAKLREIQSEITQLSRQIDTSRSDTENLERILDEREEELLALAVELEIDPDELQLGQRPVPKQMRKVPDIPNRPDPQRLIDDLQDRSALDVANMAAHEWGLEIDHGRPKAEVISDLYSKLYGEGTAVPDPTEETGRRLGLTQRQLDANRAKARGELCDLGVAKLKKLAKQAGVSPQGTKVEIAARLVAAQEAETVKQLQGAD